MVVHVWDGGLFCAWFYATGGSDHCADSFSTHVASTGADAGAIIICRDPRDHRCWRHDLYPAYKSKPDKDPELAARLGAAYEQLYEMCPAKGISVLGAKGYEADDLVGTVVKHAVAREQKTVVFSSDKDLSVLMGPQVVLTDGKTVRTAKGVMDKFGVRPEQMADYLALAGDSADAVPGVRGIGPKAAVEILRATGDLEEAIAWAGRTCSSSPAMWRLLHAQADQARLCKTLVSLRDVPKMDRQWARATR